MADDFTERYRDLLTGSYDCAGRIVLNACYPMGNTAGGFRTWWRRLIGGSDAGADAVLDNAHLMRLAGRFARRVRAWAAGNAVPVIDCKAGDRKHLIAEEYLRTHPVGPGVFMILVSKAPAMIWDVHRSADGSVIGGLARKRTYVNHYSSRIMDPQWGHLTIKMAGHAPFAAQVILNGHEYVAIAAQAAGIGFTKEGNCFTGTTDPVGLAQIAGTLSQDAAAGRLGQAIDRWIYTACLIFGLDLAHQQNTCFTYAYSACQAEYSRNLLFAYGGHMDRVFNAMPDRTRSRPGIPALRTLFGARRRPGKYGTAPSPRAGVVLETPAWDLTVFKVHFGLLTLKGYTKGEHVLRFEAITHNTAQLGCGRVLERFPQIVTALAGMWAAGVQREISSAAGRDWTDDGEVHQASKPKGGPRNAIRRVPIPPVLVMMIREHVELFGTAPDGRLFWTYTGGIYLPSTLWTVLHMARKLAFTEAQQSSLLAHKPYDFRHAGISWRLNAGTPATLVAEWAGHTVEVLLRTYAHCIDGDDDRWFGPMDDALGRG